MKFLKVIENGHWSSVLGKVVVEQNGSSAGKTFDVSDLLLWA